MLTSQKACGWVMKFGLTVRMPIPALLTSMSIPPSRDQAWPTAMVTDDSSRASISMPTAPGMSAATELARSPDRPVRATAAPVAARAEAMASPSPLVPPVTNTFVAALITARLGAGRRADEQIAVRGNEDRGGITIADPAGPDLRCAGVDQCDGGGDQPPGRQVRAERAVGLTAFHQCADRLVRAVVRARHRLRAQVLANRLSHRAVAGQVVPG